MRIPVRLLFGILIVGTVGPAFVVFTRNWSRNSGSAKHAVSSTTAWKRKTEATVSQNDKVDSISSRLISPLWWRNHIQTSCKKLGFTNQDVQSFEPKMFDHILVDDESKLLYCSIPKVASTTWRRVFLLLSGKLDITNPMALNANDVHHKYDKYLTYLSDMPRDEIVQRLNTYFKFVFVREPFERLLSAFRNKFVTKTYSASYFKSSFGRKIIERYRQNPPAQNNGTDLKFEEFVEYLIDPKRRIMMNEHWERFYKLCHPCLIKYDFIGKLEAIDEDSKYILDRQSLSEKVQVPTRADSRYSSHKTKSYMAEYYSKIPRNSLRSLLQMYHSDFVIFNYTIPDAIKALV